MFVITVKRFNREAKKQRISIKITVILVIFVRYNHEISLVNNAKPN